MANADDRDLRKSRPTELRRAVDQRRAHLPDERRSGCAHRVEVDLVAVSGLAARANAEVIGAHHCESLGCHVLREAVAGVTSDMHVPIGTRV